MPETISVLKAKFESYENIPNQALYDSLTLPQTQHDLINLVRPKTARPEFTSHPFVDLVRKRIVTEPRFSAEMTPKFRAEIVALFFPEYA
jgi:hypothetical protein